MQPTCPCDAIWLLSPWHPLVRDGDGFLYYKIMNYTKDMQKKQVRTAIINAFAFWNKYIGWKKFLETTDESKAYTKIYFMNNQSEGLPGQFGENHLAYAYSPENVAYGWDIFVNDEYNRSFSHISQRKRYLKKVLIHEIGHVLNLWHSEDIKDVMYPENQNNLSIIINAKTKSLVESLYPKSS
jgi:predicted Zn-dependent protease